MSGIPLIGNMLFSRSRRRLANDQRLRRFQTAPVFRQLYDAEAAGTFTEFYKGMQPFKRS